MNRPSDLPDLESTGNKIRWWCPQVRKQPASILSAGDDFDILAASTRLDSLIDAPGGVVAVVVDKIRPMVESPRTTL